MPALPKTVHLLFSRFRGGWQRGGCLLLMLTLTACNPVDRAVFEETDEPDFRRGKRLVRSGEYEQALISFLRLIDTRKDATDAHLEAGIIYLQHLRPPEPILAIYHFIRFLERRPEAREAPQVEKLIETAKKEFARTLPGRPFEHEFDRLELLERLSAAEEESSRLAAENARLRQENTALRQARPVRTSPPTSPAEPVRPSSPSSPSSYTVQPGDTLSSISRQVYGNAGQWERIYSANRDSLRQPGDLRPGQVLRIPPPQ